MSKSYQHFLEIGSRFRMPNRYKTSEFKVVSFEANGDYFWVNTVERRGRTWSRFHTLFDAKWLRQHFDEGELELIT